MCILCILCITASHSSLLWIGRGGHLRNAKATSGNILGQGEDRAACVTRGESSPQASRTRGGKSVFRKKHGLGASDGDACRPPSNSSGRTRGTNPSSSSGGGHGSGAGCVRQAQISAETHGISGHPGRSTAVMRARRAGGRGGHLFRSNSQNGQISRFRCLFSHLSVALHHLIISAMLPVFHCCCRDTVQQVRTLVKYHATASATSIRLSCMGPGVVCISYSSRDTTQYAVAEGRHTCTWRAFLEALWSLGHHMIRAGFPKHRWSVLLVLCTATHSGSCLLYLIFDI